MTDALATTTRMPIRGAHVRTVLAPLLFGAAAVGLWQAIVAVFDIDPFIVPSPSAIASTALDSRDSIISGMNVTGRNALIGLAIGAVLGVIGALLASASWFIDELTAPIVAALAVVPIVALAPVLYTMFGAAVNTARIIVAALAVVIPVYVNTLRGLRQVRPVHRDLMRACGASSRQIATTVTLPTALPFVFTGLRIGSSLAVISALVAEYFGGPIGGLGKSITSSAASSNYTQAWAFVLGAIVLGLAFYVATLVIELWFTRHRTT